VDQTSAILAQLDAQLFPASSAASSGGAWWHGVGAALWKLFLGPAGTVTRLHVDAGDAHGWLAQAEGWKLFILFPPAAGARLAPLAGEALQSGVEALEAAAGEELGPDAHVALLGPGEAILVPRGWWHYALSLTPSLTVQCNFYHAASNTAGLVSFVMERVRAVRAAGGQAA